jgi:lipoprotein-releasing system ATP-binding protein
MANLVVNSVSKSYETRSEPLRVLEECSLELSLGENVAIVGPSGSGKSTLLHIIGTLDTPTSGSVVLEDVNPFELNDKDLARFRNNQIGFVFQDHHLLPQLSVLENVLLPAIAHGRAMPDEVLQAKELIDRVGLADRINHRPAELSGGERQRAAVARALIRKPKLILADEPTGSLDQVNARHIGELLVGLPVDQPTMLITVTHSLELASRFQKQLQILDGQLVPVDFAATNSDS